METSVSGTLHLPNEDVTIYVEGPDAPEAYNKAKEAIITAEEERRSKLDKEKEEQT